MPIQYLGVQCFTCKTFQVQQSKKKPQYACAVCHEKQSIRKVCPAIPNCGAWPHPHQVYAVSTKAADVRVIVQQLNMARAQLDDQLNACPAAQPSEQAPAACSSPAVDWDAFVEREDAEAPEEASPLQEVHTSAAPNPRKRPRACCSSTHTTARGHKPHPTVTRHVAAARPPAPQASAMDDRDPWAAFMEPSETTPKTTVQASDSYSGAWLAPQS